MHDQGGAGVKVTMFSEQQKIASVHIPKTAGTTLRKFWTDLYGPENVYLYFEDSRQFLRSCDSGIIDRTNPAVLFVRDILFSLNLQPLYRRIADSVRKHEKTTESSLLPGDFAVVHGHFTADFISGIDPTLRLVTVIRDPLERALSHYFYWNKFASIDSKPKPEGYYFGMSFEEFSELPEMINFQTKYLGSRNISDFKYVGVTEQLDRYCRYFDPNGKIPQFRLNTTKRSPINLSDDFVASFRQANYSDYQLYETALQFQERITV